MGWGSFPVGVGGCEYGCGYERMLIVCLFAFVGVWGGRCWRRKKEKEKAIIIIIIILSPTTHLYFSPLLLTIGSLTFTANHYYYVFVLFDFLEVCIVCSFG